MLGVEVEVIGRMQLPVLVALVALEVVVRVVAPRLERQRKRVRLALLT
jgi:hypothetical protein